MTPEAVALRLLEMALAVAPSIVEVVTNSDRKTLDERIARARAAAVDPIDTSAEDITRRVELDRVTGGETDG